MTWSLHFRSAIIACAAVSSLAVSEADLSLQKEAVAGNILDNVEDFFPQLDKQKLVELLINDGKILPPPTIPECREDDGPLDHAPQLVSGSGYQCQDWSLVTGDQVEQATITPCSSVYFEEVTTNVVISGDGHLQKTSGADAVLDAWATSKPFLVAGTSGVRGFSFRPVQNDLALIAALNDPEGQFFQFGVNLHDNGEITDKSGNVFGTYGAGSKIEVVVNHAQEVEFRVDGEIRYVSNDAVPATLVATVGFQNTNAAVEGVVWVPGPSAHASIKAVGAAVDFKSQVGVSTRVGTGQLERIQGVNQASASSVHHVVQEDHIKGFTFQPMQNNKDVTIGLEPVLGPAPSFDIKCKKDGTLVVTEGDMPRGSPTSYNAGDLIEMSLNAAGLVEVQLNGKSIFTSSGPPFLPLAVRASFNTSTDADVSPFGVYNVKWAGVDSCILPESYGHPVGFDGFTGVSQLERGHFKKVLGAGWENGDASSLKQFAEDDGVSGVSFQISSKGKLLMVGLHGAEKHVEAGRFADYAVVCGGNGDFEIMEGKLQINGQFGKCVKDDVISLRVNVHGLVEFSVNNLVRYTFKKMLSPSDYPLKVVVSLHDQSAEIYNVKWTNALIDSGDASLIADDPFLFDEVQGLATMDGGRLRKLATLDDGWNAGAVVDGLPRSTRVHGVSFKPRFSDRWLMVGLGGSGTMMGWSNSDFAAHCKADGTFVIVESGNYVGEYGHYAAGSKIELVVNGQDHVEYKVDGQIRYVSQSTAVFPLSVKTFFYHAQAEAEILSSGCVERPPYGGLLELSDPVDFCHTELGATDSLVASQREIGDPMVFDQFNGLEQVGAGSVRKFTSSGLDWRSHVLSTNAIDEQAGSSPSADGFVFVAPSFDAQALVGFTCLAKVDQNVTDLDYALYFGDTGGVSVWEKGSLIGDFGTYEVGDPVGLTINLAGEIEYKVGNQVRYTSMQMPTFPLKMSAFIMNPGGQLDGLAWTQESAADASRTPVQNEPIAFHRFRGGAVALGSADGELLKLPTSAAAWNAGAISEGAILNPQQAKGVSFATKHADEDHVAQLMVGLSHCGIPLANPTATSWNCGPSTNYKAIDFGALLLRTGEFQVYEKGVFKGSFGNYKADEQIKIIYVHSNSQSESTVQYFVGDEQRYVSHDVLKFPFFVDVALYDPEAQVYDVKWA